MPGDEVFAYARPDWIAYGTYAERVAAPDRTVARKPATVGCAEAAGLPTAGATAYRTLASALRVKPGETVLVHAAAGRRRRGAPAHPREDRPGRGPVAL